MQPRNHPSAAISPKQALRLIPKIAGAYWRAAPGEASPSEAQPPRPKTRNTTCPAARVKRASSEKLPASPVFTRVSGLPIRKPSIYVGFRCAYAQTQYLRAFQICLSASPMFTGTSGRSARKCPIDKGYRSDRAEMPKRRGVQADESLRSAAAVGLMPDPDSRRPALHSA